MILEAPEGELTATGRVDHGRTFMEPDLENSHLEKDGGAANYWP